MRRPLLTALGLLVVIAAAAGQDPSTRTIDSTPKIVLRPPSETVPLPTVPPGRLPAPPEDRDRSLDVELDLKARRDALRGSETSTRDTVIAVACVVGAGIVLVSFLLWAAKRREG